jgi:hypothetical protein
MKAKDNTVTVATGTLNRTGLENCHAPEEALEGATFVAPSSDGDATAIAAVMKAYTEESLPVGSIPPPPKGLAAIAGRDLLVDKLGERIAYERSGARLYEALITKLDALGSFEGGPTREELVHIHDEEVAHFMLVADVVKRMGGDPTAQTPLADVHGVAASGLGKVVTDPRTSLAHALEAALAAELVDNEAWRLLGDLAEKVGLEEAVIAEVRAAQAEEEQHLSSVRRWIRAAVAARLNEQPLAAE